MWVHQHRARQLFCGACELRQDEHAGVGRVLRGGILLGHEVHPVTQRRDHAHLRGSHHAEQRVVVEDAVEVADRSPTRIRVSLVRVGDGAFEVASGVGVGSQSRACGRRDLQE